MNFPLTGVLGALLFAAAAQAQPQGHLLSADSLTQLSAHVWMVKGSPNIGIVTGARATLVVDDGLGTRNGEIILEAARRVSAKGAKFYLTTTHYHAEHATGDGGFPPGTELIRPRVQQQELEAEGQKLIDLFSSRSPEDKALLQDFHYLTTAVLFGDSYRLDLGGVQVTLLWLGPAHTRGDELVMVEPDSVLISGDVVQNKTGPYFYCDDCTPRSWLAVLDAISQRLHPRIVLPDHSPPGDGALVAEDKAFMEDLQTRLAALRAEGKSAEEAGRMLTAEMQAKYPDWSSLGRIGLGVSHAFAKNP